MDTKLLVATKYLEHSARLWGSRPILLEIAAECRVGRQFVAKIECELMENDRVLAPEVILMGRDHPIGLRSKTMSGEDFYVVYILYRQEPTWLLKSYE
jgi:hypothetical protein